MLKIKWLILCVLCFTCEIDAWDISPDRPPPTLITEIPAQGIVINSPGTYVFENNIIWQPIADGAAITIVSNDVTLDLRNYTLLSETTSFKTIGILALTCQNLTIKNGTVANMAFQGIQCSICKDILIKDIIVDGLNLDNIAVYTVPVGIYVNLASNATVEKCTVKNINVKTGSTAAIQMTGVLYSKITDCDIQNVLNRDGASTGIGHLLCDIAKVRSCTLDNIQSQFIDNLNTEGHTAIGIIPFYSTNLSIKYCTVSNVVGCCDDAHGMSLFECANASVKKCKVINVLDGAGAAQTGAKATGIEVYASGVRVVDCTVKNIIAINPQNKQSTGFSCAQCEEVQFIGCHAENVNVYDQFGQQSPALGYGTGFGWAPDPRAQFIVPAKNIVYAFCTAKKCQVGFDSWFHVDSVWTDIHSICNGISVLDENHSQRTISCNPCSECGCTFAGCFPNPLTVTIENVAKNNKFINVKAKYCNK